MQGHVKVGVFFIICQSVVGPKSKIIFNVPSKVFENRKQFQTKWSWFLSSYSHICSKRNAILITI